MPVDNLSVLWQVYHVVDKNSCLEGSDQEHEQRRGPTLELFDVCESSDKAFDLQQTR